MLNISNKQCSIVLPTSMVHAVLGNVKTQLTLIIDPQPEREPFSAKCPLGDIGDKIWVQEDWEPLEFSDTMVGVVYKATPYYGRYKQNDTHWYYVGADEALKWQHRSGDTFTPEEMPEWASRLKLQITSIGVERVREVCDSDAFAEGLQAWVDDNRGHTGDGSARGAYRAWWDSLYGTKSWFDNPLIWRVSFISLYQSGRHAQ